MDVAAAFVAVGQLCWADVHRNLGNWHADFPCFRLQAVLKSLSPDMLPSITRCERPECHSWRRNSCALPEFAKRAREPVPFAARAASHVACMLVPLPVQRLREAGHQHRHVQLNACARNQRSICSRGPVQHGAATAAERVSLPLLGLWVQLALMS